MRSDRRQTVTFYEIHVRPAKIEWPETALINAKEFSDGAIDREHGIAMFHSHRLCHFPRRDADNIRVPPKGE